MFVERPCPVTVSAVPSGSIERRARTMTRALGVLAAGDGTGLVVGETREQAEGLHGRVHGHEEGVDGTVALGLGADRVAVHDERNVAARAATLAGVRRPALEAHRRIGDGVLGDAGRGGLRFDDGDEVRVGDLLLGIREGDGLAVDAVRASPSRSTPRTREACPAGHAGRRACRAPGEPGTPTDWGSMIS